MSIGIVVGAGDVAAAVVDRLRGSTQHVIALDLSPEPLTRLQGDGLVSVAGDVNDEAVRTAMVRAAQESGGSIGWVLLTAGVGARGRLDTVAPERVQTTFATNVVSPILLLQALLRDCDWSSGARIVGLGSISARRPLPERTVYGATKAALEAFLVSLGVELAPRDIVVNVVSAGVIDSAFIAAARGDLDDWAAARVPAARLGRVDEVADLIAYLVKDAPAYLSATRVVLDGGAEALA
ncbi:3-oxoacyl-[acyl-carrier protein] reductase [Rhodococcus sp. 27YEA15]|uniref:SDR family NAD(P)-dependent oxidoreductase n=1 Tax=Rhodococcus sp. 27YEA15 TaxID=3156259 RepID=UPI003C7AED64